MIITLVAEAVAAGANERKACVVVGLSWRTLDRWKTNLEDRRRGPKSAPRNRLSDAERAHVLRTCNSKPYRELSPNQIVPLLADQGTYLASERTMYRLLHEQGLMRHRARSRPPSARKPPEHVAIAPNRVWSWDITYLRSRVRGMFFYLYLVVDVFSRKIVGWEVHDDERADLSAHLVASACADENVEPGELVLHADNGGPMKASTMLATLQRLGVAPSFSRPHVSDDNPYSEALFRTLKYHRTYPMNPFATVEDARRWVTRFVAWYNDEHLHSALRFITPSDRHMRRDRRILGARHLVYAAARDARPDRWSGRTRNWKSVGAVHLNPTQPVDSPVS